MGKPKGPVPSLIGSNNGRPKRVEVKGKSTCKRCKQSIEKGETCYEIPQAGRGFSSPRRFCNGCFNEILQKTEDDLVQLRAL